MHLLQLELDPSLEPASQALLNQIYQLYFILIIKTKCQALTFCLNYSQYFVTLNFTINIVLVVLKIKMSG